MATSKINFDKPNGFTLQTIDTYMQSSEHENQWERYYPVMDMFRGKGDGTGWEGVEKARPNSFLKAWHAAQIFMLNKGVTQQNIIDNPYGL